MSDRRKLFIVIMIVLSAETISEIIANYGSVIIYIIVGAAVLSAIVQRFTRHRNSRK